MCPTEQNGPSERERLEWGAAPDLRASTAARRVGGKVKTSGALPASGQESRIGPRLLVEEFWHQVPTLCWAQDPVSGKLVISQSESAAAGQQSAQVPWLIDPEAWVHRLLARINGSAENAMAAARQKPIQTTVFLKSPAGTLHQFLVVQSSVPDGNGNGSVHNGGVAMDITGHHKRVSELAYQAVTDELTGLYNLRGFLLFAEHELKVARRRETISALVYIDIDGLKHVNDTRGHSEGNQLLVATAGLLKQEFREYDVIARIGGDEFAVFASDINVDPETLCMRLQACLRDMPAPVSGGCKVTVSAGVSTSSPLERLQLAELMAEADQAMYREKSSKAKSP